MVIIELLHFLHVQMFSCEIHTGLVSAALAPSAMLRVPNTSKSYNTQVHPRLVRPLTI